MGKSPFYFITFVHNVAIDIVAQLDEVTLPVKEVCNFTIFFSFVFGNKSGYY